MTPRLRKRQQQRPTMPPVPLDGRPAAPTFVGALVAVVLVSGCTGQGQACTQVGGIDLIALDVAPEVRADLTTLHVELCQSEVCGDITFPTATPTGPYLSIQPGVTLDADTYTVALSALGEDWDADSASRLRVDGVSGPGVEVVQRSESFEFDKSYPNGKGCDPETLSYATRIDGADRVS